MLIIILKIGTRLSLFFQPQFGNTDINGRNSRWLHRAKGLFISHCQHSPQNNYNYNKKINELFINKIFVKYKYSLWKVVNETCRLTKWLNDDCTFYFPDDTAIANELLKRVNLPPVNDLSECTSSIFVALCEGILGDPLQGKTIILLSFRLFQSHWIKFTLQPWKQRQRYWQNRETANKGLDSSIW